MRAQQYRSPGQLELTITALELESAEARDTGLGRTPFVEQVRGDIHTSDKKGRKNNIINCYLYVPVPVSGWLHRPLLRDLRPRLRAGGGRHVSAARDHVSARILRGHAGRGRGVPRVPLPPDHAQQPVHQGLLPGRGQPGGCPGHVSRPRVTCLARSRAAVPRATRAAGAGSATRVSSATPPSQGVPAPGVSVCV